MLKVYGAVVWKGTEYCNNEILALRGKGRTVYGFDWVYAGDQFFEESDIYVESELLEGKSFGGRNGLRDALAYAGTPITY